MFEPDALVLDGRFRILRQLGKGGVAEVYLAEQVALSRKVALKVLRPELGLAEGMAGRFAEEVKRLAAVDHPAVVRVIDSGTFEKLLYLVAEAVEGSTLKAEAKGEPLMPDRAVAVFQQLAEGLSAIHDKGLVHRDLRPENVFLERTSRGERVRLADFGIARLVDPNPGEPRLTLITRPVGRPEYISPEQARGEATEARSDLYSLGVLAFELLSGKLPFPGPSAVEFAAQHQKMPPRPLKEAAPYLADHLRLCELVMRCLEKDPSRRPSSALEISQRLTLLPSVGEPTIIDEALQKLPPALPERQPKPPAPPPELMPSIPMPAYVPEPGPRPAQAAPDSPPAKKAWLKPGAVGLVLALIGLALLTRSTPADRARDLLKSGRGLEALALIDEAMRGGKSEPELLALKAAALHQSDNHRDEAAVLRDQLAPKSPEAMDRLVLSGLAEDFGKKEDGPARELLKRMPREALRSELEALARGRHSPAQWGALRYLDAEQAAGELDLVKLYVAALESERCPVRRLAARRLGQLGDDYAASPLSKLKDTPRSATPERACGQDEAGQALQALQRKKP
ncbi:MAG: serine/threonine protein kinase [Myxococcales bacterium]|nr:serine/threonine protein kinase [Myxococcales bacterium]